MLLHTVLSVYVCVCVRGREEEKGEKREREREKRREEKRREKREMTEIHVRVLVHKLLMCVINFPDPSYTADQCRNLSVCAHLVVHSLS